MHSLTKSHDDLASSILLLQKGGEKKNYTKSIIEQTLSQFGDYSSRARGGGYPTKLARVNKSSI
jgi:hypothetical protein